MRLVLGMYIAFEGTAALLRPLQLYDSQALPIPVHQFLPPVVHAYILQCLNTLAVTMAVN